MQKDYGTYRVLVVCYILASIYFLWSSVEIVQKDKGKLGWYSGYAWFSDWRDTEPVDYSTNKHVSNYYSRGEAKYLRARNTEEINWRLSIGDTLLIGIDYYALFSISRYLVPQEVLQQADPWIRMGDVYFYQIWR